MMYCIVYRTGGFGSWEWHRSLPLDWDQAQIAKRMNERAGYFSVIEEYHPSLALPRTFDYPGIERSGVCIG